MSNTKTALLMLEPPNDFQVKNITLRISKQRNNRYEIEPVYIQGILYPRKENMQTATITIITTMLIISTVTINNHQQSKSF